MRANVLGTVFHSARGMERGGNGGRRGTQRKTSGREKERQDAWGEEAAIVIVNHESTTMPLSGSRESAKPRPRPRPRPCPRAGRAHLFDTEGVIGLSGRLHWRRFTCITASAPAPAPHRRLRNWLVVHQAWLANMGSPVRVRARVCLCTDTRSGCRWRRSPKTHANLGLAREGRWCRRVAQH